MITHFDLPMIYNHYFFLQMSGLPISGGYSQDSNTGSCHSDMGVMPLVPNLGGVKEIEPSPEKPVTSARYFIEFAYYNLVENYRISTRVQNAILNITTLLECIWDSDGWETRCTLTPNWNIILPPITLVLWKQPWRQTHVIQFGTTTYPVGLRSWPKLWLRPASCISTPFPKNKNLSSSKHPLLVQIVETERQIVKLATSVAMVHAYLSHVLDCFDSNNNLII